MALDMLVFIRDGRVEGEPLGQHIKTGDLTDCYKFHFDPNGTGKPRYHLVYRYTPNEVEAVALEAESAAWSACERGTCTEPADLALGGVPLCGCCDPPRPRAP